MYAYTVYTANLLRQDFKIAFPTTYYIKLLVSNIQYIQLRSTKGNLFRNKKKPNQRSQHELNFFNRSRFEIESTMKIIKFWLRVFKLIPKKYSALASATLKISTTTTIQKSLRRVLILVLFSLWFCCMAMNLNLLRSVRRFIATI